MIRVDGIEFAYGDDGAGVAPFVLRVDELEIEQGAHVGIVGPSGCGKTTLLHLVAGILRPRAGRITVDDVDVTTLPETARRDFRITHVGFVFQDFELVEYLTVEQNILLPCLINPAAPLDDATRDRARDLAASMGLSDKLRRNVRKLSQGERQRVAICRAVLMRPLLILADEPTGNLDPSSKRQTIELLRRVASDNGATLIVVTHDHAMLEGFDEIVDLERNGERGTGDKQPAKQATERTARSARDPKPETRNRTRSLAWLAWREACDQRMRTAILVACLAVVMYLPVAVRWITAKAQAEMERRAASTPLVLGSPGSRFDLTLHALYFRGRAPSPVTMADVDTVRDTGRALVMPLHTVHTARGYPVVGATLDYLDFRGLRVTRGDPLTRLGDCVLGADVADALDISPGDYLMTDPDNVFDLAGGYPLNMRVVGVLERAGTPDDGGVFVDLRTSWIISGLGHGHDDTPADSGDTPAARGNVVVPPGVVEYQQITDENVDAFHFHGEPAAFPVTAIIAAPHDAKAATLLSARFQDGSVVALRPRDVIMELGAMVLRVRRVFGGIL